MGNYKLIISDFDGTLLRSDHTIGERTVNAISSYVDGGGIFAVCTGRMITSIMPEVRALKLKGLVASYQGSVIADIETGEIVRNVGFTKEQALMVSRVMEDMGLWIHAYLIDSLYASYDNEYLSLYEQICKIKAERLKIKTSEFILGLNTDVIKLVAMVKESDNQRVLNELQERLGDEYYVTASASVLVEVMPKTHTKGEAVKYLADHYGVDIAQTVAIGDNLNDAPMLEVAGLGVAVANARAELKALADEITLSNDEDGVGYIVEKYGIRREINE